MDDLAFSLEERTDYAIVQFPAALEYKLSKEFKEQTEAWQALTLKALIFDFHRVTKIEPILFRPLVLLQQALKKKGCTLFTIHASGPMCQIIKDAGLDSVFSPKVALAEALRAVGIKPPRVAIDVNFLNPFIDATQKTIRDQARTPIKAGRPFLKSGPNGVTMDIAGVISMSSPAFQGSIALCFPANVFLHIYSNMMNKPHTVITDETEEAAGELLNVIFGQAKARLNADRNYAIHEAIPTVIKGSQLSVHHTARPPALVIPFETKAGVFHVEISADAA